MKNSVKLLAIIAMVALIGFSFIACGEKDGDDDTTTYSLDGAWQADSGGVVITINGSTGVFTQIGSSGAWSSAVSKGYVKVGDQGFRNLTKTGDLTWSGQATRPLYNTSAPNVAISMDWVNVTITMNANGQTFQYNGTNQYGNFSGTFTKITPTLNGTWKVNTTDAIVTITGSTGVITQWQTSNALWQSAKDKGYINIGDQWFKNLTKTGDLTWTGQAIAVTYNTSAPNVATGTTWQNCTIVMNSNGQTFQSTTSTGTATYTRQ